MALRPPPVVVHDDAPVRSDLDDDTVRGVYPDLPTRGDWRSRVAYLRARDARAYALIRDAFPDLRPPTAL